jgi:opacity protein-like surface antigen
VYLFSKVSIDMIKTGNRVVRALGAVTALATIIAGPAFAADLPTYVYEEPVYDKAGAWYLRGDIGYVATRDYEISYDGSAGYQEFLNEDFSNTWLIGVGVGYKFNHFFRADLTLDYRAEWDFEANTVCASSCGATLNDEYGSGSMYTLLANIYFDWENSSSFTPYIGGGVGLAYIDVGRQIGLNVGGSSYSNFEGDGAWNFAAAAMAGVSYEVSHNFAIDANYRYLWVGDVEGGSSDTPGLTGHATYHDVDFHEIRLGGRYTFH